MTTQPLSLHLTPMQLFAATDTPRLMAWENPSARSGSAASVSSKTLLLRPGEPSELVVQLRHLGEYPIEIEIQAEGDFPLEWCRIGSEGSQILPGQSMEVVLYFQIPADWFESESDQSININRTGRLCVKWIEPETGRRQIEWASFNLRVRPRSLYLSFLPAIYQEIDFVGRFLRIFEESFEPTVQTIDTLWAYLDPLTAPEAMLPFLAHWIGWESNGCLTLEKQRLLIRHAMEIYRWRGTRRGLRFYLHLATGLPLDENKPEDDRHISITECFGDGLILGVAALSQDALVGGGKAFHFKVRLRSNPSRHLQPGLWIDEQLVRQIIDQEKPAFCTYDLQIEA
jgi:phage tail-like protein